MHSNNAYLENFVSELQGRYGILDAGAKYSDWITKNTKLNGRHFSFEDHEFQIDIVNDTAEHVVVKKCSQVGLTEIAIRRVLAFLVRNQGTTTIMTQPTRQMALNFSTTRVDEIIKESPLIENLADRNVDSKELKKLGRSYLYIKGTKGAASAISVPADFIMTDEYDFSDLAVVGKYNSRLSHSKYKLIWRFSTPTIPDFAVSKEFNQGTQFQRLQKCPHCNHWNNHDFFRDLVILGYEGTIEELTMDDLLEINPNDVQLLCEKCRRPMQYHNYTKQEWVATHPNRFIHSYQVRPWHTAAQRMYDVLRQREDYELYSDWVNFALGEEYIDANQIFDLGKVKRGSFPMGPIPMFIGIDFGKECYIVVGHRDQRKVIVRYAKKVSEHKVRETVQDLINNYFISGMILDALPQTKLSSDIRDLMWGSAYTAYYSDNQKELFNIKSNEEDITLSRTKLFDKVLAIDELDVTVDAPRDFEEQLQGMVKQRLKDDVIESERYVKVQADHFLHALGYMYAAMEVFEASGSHIVLPTLETTKIVY